VPYPRRVPGLVDTTERKTEPIGKASVPPGGLAKTPSARKKVVPPEEAYFVKERLRGCLQY